MTNRFPLEELAAQFKNVLGYAPKMLGNDAVNFFSDSFKKQGWQGDTFQPWVKRKAVTKWGKTPRNNGSALLVLSGRLRRSIRVTNVTGLQVKIGSDVPYAKAHNEGLRLGEIQNVREYQRKATKLGITNKKTLKTRSNITFGRVQTGTVTVHAHKRRIDMKIPRRQFMGYSPVLDAQLRRRLTAELMKGLRTM